MQIIPEQTVSFLNNLTDLENMIKADAVKNSKDWFNKGKMTPEVVDALWSPMLKYPKNLIRMNLILHVPLLFV